MPSITGWLSLGSSCVVKPVANQLSFDRAFNSLVDEIVASAAIRVNAPVEFIDKIRLDKLIAQHEASLGVTVSPKR